MTEKKDKKNIILYIKSIFKREKKLFSFLFIIFLLIIIIPKISEKYLLEIPKTGGSIAEIEIENPPRFLNPVLAISDTDKDMIPLVYSSLLKRNSLGEIIPNIASVKLSKDKKNYTITLDKNIKFSDGKNLTADDVIFTIKKIQDPLIRSPYDVQWINIVASKIDDYTLKITLPSEYSQFENSLASLYILPKHLWFDIPPTEFPFSNLNRKPIGSGPYKINTIITDNNGKIKKYNLIKNENYFEEKIFIDNISFYFFDSYNDYKKSLIFSDRKLIKNIFSISTKLVPEISNKESFLNPKIISLHSSRKFGLFINKQNTLKNIMLRKAISLTIDSDNIIKNQLSGYAKNIYPNSETPFSERLNIAKKILEKEFYIEKNKNGKSLLFNKDTKKPVQIKMSILESDEFKSIAKEIKSNLYLLGIDLDVTAFEEHKLINSVIRNRDFDILLFGYQENITNPDMYYFFHSSQIFDPGINISGFSNSNADKIILELRKNISEEERNKKIKKLEELIISDYSYIPIYSPNFIYIMDSRIKNFNKKALNSREERFDSISRWYAQTEKVLPIFGTQE